MYHKDRNTNSRSAITNNPMNGKIEPSKRVIQDARGKTLVVYQTSF